MPGETQRRERKVVTVVFCDLVGFTSSAETIDPEDAGRRAEAETQLAKALDFYRPIRATLFAERGERLLAQAQRDSA